MLKKGFTLIELLAVIVILTAILSITVPAVIGILKSATKGAFRSDAIMVLQAIEYKKLENDGFAPQEVTKENMNDLLGLDSSKYQQVNISVTDGKIEIILVGQDDWDGFTAYGSRKNMRVVNTNEYDIIPPSITIIGSNPMDIGKNSVYVDAGATATDLKDGSVAIASTIIRNASNIEVASIDTSSFGTYTVTYTAVDQNGNASSSVRRVNIVDKIDPIITILGDNPVTLNVGSTYIDAGATALDDIDGDVTNSITTTGTIVPSIVGTYAITYTAEDEAGNIASITRTVNVIDTISPTVSFGTNGNSTYAKTRSTTITVSDANTGVNTSSLKFLWNTSSAVPSEATFSSTFTNGSTLSTPVGVTGSYYLWILAEDNSGNLAIIKSNIFNLDNTPPVITLIGSSSVTVNKGTTYSDAGATVTDSIDTSVTATSSGTVNINIIGSYTITYSASDAAFNIATNVTRTINVVDVSAPVITILGSNPATVSAGSVYSDAGATALDDVDGDVTSSIVKTGNVNPNVLGTYTINYTVEDNAGNNAVSNRTVNVIDNIAPTVNTVASPTAWSNANKTITVTASDTGLSGIAGYYISTTTAAPTLASSWTASTSGTWTVSKAIGTYYIWVKDSAGNISTTYKSVDVTNIDTVAPATPTITGGSTTYATSRTITVTAPTETGSGINRYEYYLSSSSTAPTVGTVGTSNGTVLTKLFNTNYAAYYVYFRAVDNVGNVGAWSSAQRLYIDINSPTITANSASYSITKNDSYVIASSYFTSNQNGNATISTTGCVDTSSSNATVTNTSALALGTHAIKCTVTKITGTTAYATTNVVVNARTYLSLPAGEYVPGQAVTFAGVNWHVVKSVGANVTLLADSGTIASNMRFDTKYNAAYPSCTYSPTGYCGNNTWATSDMKTYLNGSWLSSSQLSTSYIVDEGSGYVRLITNSEYATLRSAVGAQTWLFSATIDWWWTMTASTSYKLYAVTSGDSTSSMMEAFDSIFVRPVITVK